jgi:hypothetical protein
VNIVDELYAITAALNAAAIPYAVCGGVAVSAHGAPRTTKDIDIAVARADLSRALQAVSSVGYTLLAAPMTFGAGTSKERNLQRVTKIEPTGDHLTLDLLIAEAGYAGILDDRLELPLAHGSVTFVSRETLLKMKRAAGRPMDLIDIERLENDDEA